MFTSPCLLFVALTLVMVAPAHAHVDDPPLGRKDRASVQEATQDLAREVEYLQDLIVESSGQKERDLYRQADAVLAHIGSFQESLKPKTSHERLNKAFDELDRKVHEFLKAVQALGPEQRLLQRSANRVGAADDHLHYALSAPGASEGRAKQVLERQTRTLVIAARQLDKKAFSKTVGEKAKAMKEQVANLWKKTEGLTGDEKTHSQNGLCHETRFRPCFGHVRPKTSPGHPSKIEFRDKADLRM